MTSQQWQSSPSCHCSWGDGVAGGPEKCGKEQVQQNPEEALEKQRDRWSWSDLPSWGGSANAFHTEMALFPVHTLRVFVDHSQQSCSAVRAALLSCLSSLLGNKWKRKTLYDLSKVRMKGDKYILTNESGNPFRWAIPRKLPGNWGIIHPLSFRDYLIFSVLQRSLCCKWDVCKVGRNSAEDEQNNRLLPMGCNVPKSSEFLIEALNRKVISY